jgi:curved DNA-binding protein CbpA
MKDYYKILQIDSEASLEVMNNAYRALVRQYHPDLYHTHRKTVMTEKMQEINEAYQVLSNATTRAEYDKKRHSTSAVGNNKPLSTPTLRQTIKRMLLWSVGSYLAMRFLLVPFLSNPALKIVLLFAMIFGLIRLYSKRKPSA